MMSIGLWAQEAVFTHVIDVGTSYVSWVELPVQRRLCPIFLRNVGSPDIHECFRGLTGSQRIPGFGGVTLCDKHDRVSSLGNITFQVIPQVSYTHTEL